MWIVSGGETNRGVRLQIALADVPDRSGAVYAFILQAVLSDRLGKPSEGTQALEEAHAQGLNEALRKALVSCTRELIADVVAALGTSQSAE